MSSENAFIGIMFDSDKMRIFTVMGRTTIPNKHHAMMLMWALLLLQVGKFFTFSQNKPIVEIYSFVIQKLLNYKFGKELIITVVTEN